MNTEEMAFPSTVPDDREGVVYHNLGMTLRDYFAAKALAALINHDGKDGETRGKKAVPILAEFAYEYADAMLKERAK
jgi:hypothetical protein